MNEIEIEARLAGLCKRYRTIGGYDLSVIIWPGRWAVSSGGGSPRVSTSGTTAADALTEADQAIAALERAQLKLAETLGVQ